MAKKIALFKITGDVTTAGFIYHLSSLLAQGGHCVLMVDADPQCNLTSLVLLSKRESSFEEFYQCEPERNIFAGLSPVFDKDLGSISPIECLPITRKNDIFLLPGNVRLIEYEACIECCRDLPGMEHSPLNYESSLSHLIDVTAAHYNADFVLIDMGPTTGILNRDILMASDYFMIIATPRLSSITLDQIPLVFSRWHTLYENLKDIKTPRPACCPCVDRQPKFLGMIIQELCLGDNTQAEILQNTKEGIAQIVKDRIVPALRSLGMVIPEARHEGVEGLYPVLFDNQLPEIAKRISKMGEYSNS